MIKNQIRQGDVLVMPRKRGSKGKAIQREGNRVVLAHGEVTGHAHAIGDIGVQLYAETSTELQPDTQQAIGIGGGLIPDRILLLTQDVPLQHEEHGDIVIRKGQRTVRIQEEYSPAELRNVAD